MKMILMMMMMRKTKIKMKMNKMRKMMMMKRKMQKTNINKLIIYFLIKLIILKFKLIEGINSKLYKLKFNKIKLFIIS